MTMPPSASPVTPLSRRVLLYVEGPGNIVDAYAAWKRREDFATETSLTFSSQVFEFCRQEGCKLVAVSYCSQAGAVVDGLNNVFNLPRWDCKIPKVGYLLTSGAYAFRLLLVCLRHRPAAVLINSGVVGWSLAPLLVLSRAKIFPVLHNTLWANGVPPRSFSQRMRQRSRGFFFSRCVAASFAVSPAAARQVQLVSQPRTRPVFAFRPTFSERSFPETVTPRSLTSTPFAILFAGRVEADKGIWDVLHAAEQLNDRFPGRFRFIICGQGEALPDLTRAVESRGLGTMFMILGRLARVELVQQYLQAHIVIVPTRTSFAEGYAQVVAEAILLLRPVLTSAVVPAAELCSAAVVLAEPDQADSYAEQIVALASSPARYDALVEGCRSLRSTLLSPRSSLLCALTENRHAFDTA